MNCQLKYAFEAPLEEPTQVFAACAALDRFVAKHEKPAKLKMVCVQRLKAGSVYVEFVFEVEECRRIRRRFRRMKKRMRKRFKRHLS